MGAIVLECTDMSYFAPLIQKTVNLPVFDIITLTNMVYQAVVRKPFGG
jgi:Asp/Glu/hydantoin racemase